MIIIFILDNDIDNDNDDDDDDDDRIIIPLFFLNRRAEEGLSFGGCRLLIVWVFVVCCLLFGVWCLMFVVCCLLKWIAPSLAPVTDAISLFGCACEIGWVLTTRYLPSL